jgi:hypothetical protein
MTYQDEGVFMKYLFYAVLVSTLAILQIINSVWLVRKVGDSETNSKTVYLNLYSYHY